MLYRFSQEAQARLTRIAASALLISVVGGVALTSTFSTPTVAYAEVESLQPEWKQDHNSDWKSTIGGVEYIHRAGSKYTDEGHLIGDCIFDIVSGVREVHAKYTFYRSDATVDGVAYKKGTLVVEPTDEKGWLNAQFASSHPWKDDSEIQRTATRIILKQKNINGKDVSLVLKNTDHFNMQFAGLSEVQILDLRGLMFDSDTSKNTSVSRMFESCVHMHTLLFNPSHTFEQTKDFGRMFAGCARLSHVLAQEPSEAISYDELDAKKEECDLSGLAIFNTSQAISMQHMFECCWKMTDFRFSEYPHWDTSKVKSFFGMFTGIWCRPFDGFPQQGIDAFTIQGGKLTNATGGFRLKKLDLSALDTSSAQNMKHMFMGQEGLEELNLSGKFKIGNQVDTDLMFRGAHAIRKLTVGKEFCLSNLSAISEPSDNIYNTYIKPHFQKDNTNAYSGKWVPDGKDTPEVSSEDFWNSSKLENLTKDLADGESLTMVWQLKTPAAPTIPQLTLLSETGDFEVEISGKKVKRFAINVSLTSDKKIDPSTLPQKNADGKTIVGWYKQGDATKAKIDVAAVVIEENTTLIALYEDSGSGGGTTGGGTGGTTGGGTGGTTGGGTGGTTGGGTTGGSGTGGTTGGGTTGGGSTGGTSGSGGGVGIGGMVDEQTRIAMHRLYNPWTGEHLFTTDINEVDSLTSCGWNHEGMIGMVDKKVGNGVYRLYNPNTGDHHYTMNEDEIKDCVSHGWVNEGIKFYSVSTQTQGARGMVSMYNPYEKAFFHHYTSDAKEIATMQQAGWRKEDIKWYVM